MTIKKQPKAVKNILNNFLSHYLIKYNLYNGFNYYNKDLKLSPDGEIVQFYYD